MSFRKVSTGEQLQIPAQAYNAFVDAAIAHQETGQKQSRLTQSNSQQTSILVRNTSDQDMPRFAVMGADSPAILPADNEDEFTRQVALNCVVPVEADHKGKFVILLEPLAPGSIGRAKISGVCLAKLEVEDEDAKYADVIDGDGTMLITASDGAAQILWRGEPKGESSKVWAVVRLGSLGGKSVFVIRITGSSQLSANRWNYNAVEQVPEKLGRYKDKALGWTGTAYNTIEANNAATGIQGSGDDTGHFPEGVELKPIGSGAIVNAWRILNCEGNEEVHFAAPNNAGGSCEGGAA
ncbi:hypothetical protein KS4_10980 [Poriferisphaera corsica]|uniref:Uncharacterized protein n=1 Tax=Poriferisphaera corsica TaxID=2528020 RepID=A0A517YS44_9BACT|nr:hypothetical protein [Poriferisphaera corsica]QDU33057.1 hypothetical protein KS4_10980 [Poriferisphaera corsica]